LGFWQSNINCGEITLVEIHFFTRPFFDTKVVFKGLKARISLLSTLTIKNKRYKQTVLIKKTKFNYKYNISCVFCFALGTKGRNELRCKQIEFTLQSVTNGSIFIIIKLYCLINYNPSVDEKYETIYVLDGEEIFVSLLNRFFCNRDSDNFDLKMFWS